MSRAWARRVGPAAPVMAPTMAARVVALLTTAGKIRQLEVQ